MRTVTMQEAEARQERERREAWLAFAEMLEQGERGGVRLSLVRDRVPRLRRTRRGGRGFGPVAA